MKIRFLDESYPIYLLHGKVYDVISIEKEWYRIIDEEGEDYLYPPDIFEIVDDSPIKNIAESMESLYEKESETYYKGV